MRILVTGGAGFIGSAVIRRIMSDSGDAVLNVDKLTYAGNPAALSSVAGDPRYHFAQADICDAAAMQRLFAEFRPDAVMHFAALAYVTFPLWWLEAGLETALAGLLALGAVLAQSRKWNLAAATLAGMALLLRPVALVLGVLLLLDTALDQRRLPWRELIALALLALLSVVLVVWAFGWPLPPRTLLGGTPAGPPLTTSAPTSRSLVGLGRLAGGLLAQSLYLCLLGTVFGCQRLVLGV